MLSTHKHPHTHTHARVLTACCCVPLQDNLTTLHLASQEGHDGVTAKLLEAKADVNASDKVILWLCGACVCVYVCVCLRLHACVEGW